jgi:tetratricopeptide (TPR) repeat protein
MGPSGPAVDRDVTGQELDRAVLRELTTLRADAAQDAAQHLVMAARLLDDNADAAFEHAMAARRCGPRVGVIREAVGLAAYACGRWAEALAELRAARRISGIAEHWPVMADCERALGRPDRALQMAADPEAGRLDRAGVVELRIVAAGARTDLGQLAAAVVTLQTPELNESVVTQWSARLRFAYAASLEAVGRDSDARLWYRRAAEVDPEGSSGAAERLLELDGVSFLEMEEVGPVVGEGSERTDEHFRVGHDGTQRSEESA